MLARALAALASLSAASAAGSGGGKSVNAELKSGWASTPLDLEAAEFAASASGNEAFWEVVALGGEGFAALPDEARYKAVGAHVAETLGDAGAALLDISLSAREFSPIIAMHRQMAAATWRETGKGAMPCAFATVDGKAATSAEQLGPLLQACSGAAAEAELHEFDHVFAGGALKDGAPTVVLYGRFGSPEFRAFHAELAKRAEGGELVYVVRHSDCGCGEDVCAEDGSRRFNVQGFGVELAIKSVEYKVKDDSAVEGGQEEEAAVEAAEDEDVEVDGIMFGTLIKRRPELKSDLQNYRDFLLSSQSFDEPLKVWEMKDLGAQAAVRVADASDSLRMLRDVSGNFPSLAKSLTKVGVNESFKFELQSNTQAAQSLGYFGNVFAVSGETISVDGINEAVDVFQVLNIVKKNMRKVTGLTQLGIPAADAKAWLQPGGGEDGGGGGGGAGEQAVRYNVCSDATVWLNDMENDESTMGWSNSLQTLLEPSQQMQIYIRKNLFTAVLPLDPGSAEGLFTLASLEDNLKQQMPIRLGLLVLQGPVKARSAQWDDWAAAQVGKTDGAVESADGSLSPLIARAFLFLAKKRGNAKAVSWAAELYNACEEGPAPEGMDQMQMMMMMMQGGGAMMRPRAPPTAELVKETLRAFVERYKIKGTYKSEQAFEDFYEKLHTTDKFDKQFADAEAFTASLGVTTLPSLFVNGQLYAGDATIIQQLPYTLREQYPVLVNEVRAARITDDDEVQQAFCEQPATRSRILPQLESAETWAAPWMPTLVKSVPHDDSHYVTPAESGVSANTLWAVVDADSTLGLQLLAATLEHAHKSEDTRAAVFVNSATSPVSQQAAVFKALLGCSGVDASEVLAATEAAIGAALTGSSDEDALLGALSAELRATADKCLKQKPRDQAMQAVREDAAFVGRELQMEGQKSALLLNGAWYVPKATAPLFAADIASLEKSEARSARALELLRGLADWKGWEKEGAGVLSDKVASVAALLPKNDQLFALPPELSTEYTLVQGGNPDALVHAEAIVNPLTTTANMLATIMHVLSEKLGGDFAYKVLLLPELENANEGELPLNKYYRYALSGDVSFEDDGAQTIGAGAIFTQLPSTPILTLGMHTLNSWMISPETAIYDLDNIVLADLGKASTLYAEYGLRHLLAQGSCVSHTNSTEGEEGGYAMEGVASGLELLLGENKLNPHVADTVVMENLGYFQLRANPGIWYLHMGGSKYELNADVSVRATCLSSESPPLLL